jgi:hypothetical protein
MAGTRINWEAFGSARRFEGATRGGAMREEVAGFMGGAMRFCFGGGAMAIVGGRAPALCAEFRAGKDGGGKLSSSSSSELSWASSVKVGTVGTFGSSRGVAFGVVCGDCSCEVLSVALQSCNSTCRCPSGALPSRLASCDLSSGARAAPSLACA